MNSFLKKVLHIFEYVKFLNRGKKPLHSDVIVVEDTIEDTLIEIAFQYTEDYGCNLKSFTNNIFNCLLFFYLIVVLQHIQSSALHFFLPMWDGRRNLGAEQKELSPSAE